MGHASVVGERFGLAYMDSGDLCNRDADSEAQRYQVGCCPDFKTGLLASEVSFI